jgi:hypothetical protein
MNPFPFANPVENHIRRYWKREGRKENVRMGERETSHHHHYCYNTHQRSRNPPSTLNQATNFQQTMISEYP